MRFEKKDIVTTVIATALALMAMVQDNTFVSVVLLIVAASFACYGIAIHEGIYREVRSLLFGVVIFSAFSFGLYIANQNFEKEMRQYYGTIYPSTVETPPSSCNSANDIVLFFAGNNIIINEFPIAIISIDSDPILVLDKTHDGAIIIKYLLLNDENEDNIVDINSNVFWISPTVERLTIPERDRLVVKDHSGRDAINIAFLNPTHLALSGNFNHKKYRVDVGLRQIDIYLSDGTKMASFTNNCFHNHRMNLTSDGIHWDTDTGISLFIARPPKPQAR